MGGAAPPNIRGIFISAHLVVEEMYGMFVEPEGESLQEGDVVSHDLLVGEIELVDDDGVDVVVGEKIVCKDRKKTTLELVARLSGSRCGSSYICHKTVRYTGLGYITILVARIFQAS